MLPNDLFHVSINMHVWGGRLELLGGIIHFLILDSHFPPINPHIYDNSEGFFPQDLIVMSTDE